MVDIYDALDHLLVFLGVVNEIESALRSYECKTTARQYESANLKSKIEKLILKKCKYKIKYYLKIKRKYCSNILDLIFDLKILLLALN